jgi:hypothetical protein
MSSYGSAKESSGASQSMVSSGSSSMPSGSNDGGGGGNGSQGSSGSSGSLISSSMGSLLSSIGSSLASWFSDGGGGGSSLGSSASSSGGAAYIVRAEADLTPERLAAYGPAAWLWAKKLIDGVPNNDVPWVFRGNTSGGGLFFTEGGEDIIYQALIVNPYPYGEANYFLFQADNNDVLETGTDDLIQFSIDWKIEVFNVGTVDIEVSGFSQESIGDPGDLIPDVIIPPGESHLFYQRAVLAGSSMDDRVELSVTIP